MLLISWVAAILSAFLPPQTPSVDPQVQINVAVHLYRADGSTGGWAGGPIKEADSLVWVSFSPTACGTGAGAAAPTSSAYTWKTTGRIVNHEGPNYTIDLDVARTPGTASEPQVRQRTVTLGERVILDEISNIGGPCHGRTARLEASVEVAQPPRGMTVSSGRGGAAGGVAGAGVSAGTVGGERAGAPAAPAPPTAVGPDSRLVLVGGDPSPSMFVTNALANLGESASERSLVAEPGTSGGGTLRSIELRSVKRSYRVELWLVHTLPDGTQQTFPRLERIDEAGGVSRFLVPIRLATGPVLVLVGASLRPMATVDGKPMLRAVIAREVQGVSQGVSSRAVPMPAGADVVSFELPEVLATMDGHHLELRVRLTPTS